MEAETALGGLRENRYELLYRRHAPQAARLAFLLTGHRELAEDLAQEAFLRAAVRVSLLRRPDAFRAYLRRSVINLARKHWSRRATERTYLAARGPQEAARVVELPDLATRDELWQALQRLPYDQRAAIVLRYFEDLTERDAAAALGCPRGTLKSRVSRGLEALRVEMRGDQDE